MWKIKVNGNTKLNEGYKFIEKKENFDSLSESKSKYDEWPFGYKFVKQLKEKDIHLLLVIEKQGASKKN